MKSIFIAITAALALSACAGLKPTIPENYQGPTARIKDSTKRYSTQKADLFYIETVDGERINSTLMRTRSENEGKGMFMRVVLADHVLPAQTASFGLIGHTQYAAPILAMINPVYRISGQVRFTPEAGKTYVVKGELGEDYSALWIEEEESHTIMDRKIEIQGSAKTGIFGK